MKPHSCTPRLLHPFVFTFCSFCYCSQRDELGTKPQSKALVRSYLVRTARLGPTFATLTCSNLAGSPPSEMLFLRSSILISNAITGSNALTGISKPLVHNLFRAVRHQSNLRTTLPAPPPLSVLATSKDVAAARDWVKSFGGCTIPKAMVDIAFSRSSGPGGQVRPHSLTAEACGVINRAITNN